VSPREKELAPEGADERLGRQEKKAVLRQRILEAAREVFFRDGFMGANLVEVAQLAKVAKGTLYRYFDNKGELYVAILSSNGEIFERRMREAAASGHSPVEQMRALGRFYFEHWTRNREYFQIFWALENQSVIGELPPGVVEEVARLWENCLRILADVIERGAKEGTFARCDAWEVANILWTVANGLLQAEHVVTRRELRRRKLDRVFEDTVELFLRGLANPSPPG
jgi:AcrR family transcriptional regulator